MMMFISQQVQNVVVAACIRPHTISCVSKDACSFEVPADVAHGD
jgi:hypothetical protein